MNRKQELKEALTAVRNRTLSLLSEVPDEFLRVRVHNFYSPIGWHFGHVGRTEEYWVCKATGQEPHDQRLSFLYADLPDNPKDNRVNIPDRAETIAYLSKTREFTLQALNRSCLNENPYEEDGYAWEFAVQHECQHQETIAEMLHLIRKQLPLERVEPIEWKGSPSTRMIPHPSGEFMMGDANLHGYDNEKTPHLVKVEEFLLAENPVTAYEWSEFMNEGGYAKKELWSEEGWSWKLDNQVTMPEYWIEQSEGFAFYGGMGLRAIHPQQPASSISHFEAEAYSRWKGMRLPTEQEWEYAASAAGGSKRRFAWGDEAPSNERAQHALTGWKSSPVNTRPNGKTPLGVQDMSGNVWEWTGSKFLPYPGFKAFPYDGYSKDHMLGGHFVCRGGSWATSPTILRNSFRNWYVPTYRQGFLGVRLADG